MGMLVLNAVVPHLRNKNSEIRRMVWNILPKLAERENCGVMASIYWWRQRRGETTAAFPGTAVISCNESREAGHGTLAHNSSNGNSSRLPKLRSTSTGWSQGHSASNRNFPNRRNSM